MRSQTGPPSTGRAMNVALRHQQQTPVCTPVGRAVTASHVLIIHPVPLMRRGLASTLAEGDRFHDVEFLEATGVSQAEAAIRSLTIGDVVVVGMADVSETLSALGA